ncbi:hypothetical protein J6590_055863 [Homalodisca vitripennis]|nr:hypothetical protein J6590_055863 [Homalodisca vitripennis]
MRGGGFQLKVVNFSLTSISNENCTTPIVTRRELFLPLCGFHSKCSVTNRVGVITIRRLLLRLMKPDPSYCVSKQTVGNVYRYILQLFESVAAAANRFGHEVDKIDNSYDCLSLTSTLATRMGPVLHGGR